MKIKTTRRSVPAPWLFGIALIPYGVVGTFAGTVMPRMTKLAGFSVAQIGRYGTILLVPPIVQFLYAPIVDIGLPRKHWLIVVAAIGAACMFGAFTMPLPEHIYAYLTLAFFAQMISGLVGSCAGGLLSVVIPDDQRGRASAWYNIGNLSGGGLAGYLALYMIDHGYTGASMGAVMAAMMVLPSFAILAVPEPERDHIPRARDVFGTTYKDVKHVLGNRSGITGFLLCVSPVGTAALLNYFAALSDDYHASDQMVEFVNGSANAALTAVGALIGGYLCDRFNRRAMYLLSGVLTAAVGVAMAIAPHVPSAYAIAVCTYFLVAGLCFSAFTATILETIGTAGKAASTQYAVFVAAGNLAIAYVGFIDTRFHEAWGVRGVVGSDAGLNLLGVAVLGIVFWKMGSFGRKRAAKPAPLPEARVHDAD